MTIHELVGAPSLQEWALVVAEGLCWNCRVRVDQIGGWGNCPSCHMEQRVRHQGGVLTGEVILGGVWVRATDPPTAMVLERDGRAEILQVSKTVFGQVGTITIGAL